LVVGGLTRDRALRYLRDAGLTEPPGVEWVGVLPQPQWLGYLSRARIFVNASRYEDWGIAQLETLSAGTPLVTVPTPGPNRGLSLALRLCRRLVATDSSVSALAEAIRVGLTLSSAQRQAYARSADAMLEPYRFEVLAEVLRQEIMPALLGNPS
jgi:glycosyltransferase involved in cell wall biosynthesis